MWPVAVLLVWVVGPLNLLSLVQGSKCCVTQQRLTWPHPNVPNFQGFCQPVQRLGLKYNVQEYMCGDFGYVQYKSGNPIHGKPGERSGAVVQVQTTPEYKRPYIQVSLHCDPQENPGLKEHFFITGAVIYCNTATGRTFSNLHGCAKPRISYSLASVEEEIHCAY